MFDKGPDILECQPPGKVRLLGVVRGYGARTPSENIARIVVN